MIVVEVLILLSLGKLLLETEKPLLCSGLYAVVVVLFDWMIGTPPRTVFVDGALAFGLASVYFWLLNRLEYGSLSWWIVVIGGLFIALF